MAYDDIVMEAAVKYQVPPSYIQALIGKESSGRPNAESRRGAMGLMQLMPATYESLRGPHGLGEDPFDPRNNIMAGTAYFREMVDRYNGNPRDALAAYNMGPSAYDRYKAGAQTMPLETVNYLRDLAPKMNVPDVPEQDVPMRPEPKPLLEEDPAAPAPAPAPAAAEPAKNPLAGLLDGYDLEAPDKGSYLIAGGLAGLAPMMGGQKSRITLGQVIAGLGAGVNAGGEKYKTAVKDQRTDMLNKLQLVMKLKAIDASHRSAAALADALEQSGNPAQIQLGKAVRENPALADEIVKGAAGEAFKNIGGPFRGDNPDVQGVNALINAGIITKQQGADWLAGKTLMGPNGAVDFTSPTNVYPRTAGGVPGTAVPGTAVPGTAVPGTGAPGVTVPGTQAPSPTGVQRLRPPVMDEHTKKQIDETTTTIQSAASAQSALQKARELSDRAYQGPLAGAKQMGSRITGIGADAGQATTEFTSIMTEQALNSLKATFGSAPTEGERKILLDMQAAATMSIQERNALLDRAQAAVENRLKLARERNARLINGTAYTEPAVEPDPITSNESVTDRYGLTPKGN